MLSKYNYNIWSINWFLAQLECALDLLDMKSYTGIEYNNSLYLMFQPCFSCHTSILTS